MSCKSVLNKLSSNQLKHCLNLGSIMSSFKSPSSQAVYQFNNGKRRGKTKKLLEDIKEVSLDESNCKGKIDS